MAKRRIGIFSGTFDPVHQGHVAFCMEAMRACRLHKIVLLPERVPRGKQDVTALPHRTALLRHAVEPFPDLHVAVLDTDQFTVGQTLPELQKLFGDATLTLLIGSDVARTFPYRWEGLKTLFESTLLAIGLRQEDTAEEITAVMRQLEDKYRIPIRCTLIESRHPGVTSSQIRGGNHIPNLNPAVDAYIKQHKLYNISKI